MLLKLDKQYKFLHINIYNTTTKLSYDSIATLHTFSVLDKKFGIYGVFDEVLNTFNINTNDDLDELDDPQISWMDYKENYVPDNKDKDLTDDINDDDDEDGGMPKFLPIGMFGGEQYEVTPWGKFVPADPLNPMNLYDDIKVMHLKGFSFNDIMRLEVTMNSIHGVARWFLIDNYSAIICMAKAYTSTEVIHNIEEVIYTNLGKHKFSKLEESAIEAQQESEEMKEENIILVFPNGSKKVITNPSPQDIVDVENTLSSIDNSIAFKNGEIYESGETGN